MAGVGEKRERSGDDSGGELARHEDDDQPERTGQSAPVRPAPQLLVCVIVVQCLSSG
jgi:hypothetical protein